MSKKNPAFLFYSKDWLVDTAEMLAEEKGIYIDLLAYQHQNDSLPADPSRLAQMVGMSETQFRKIWKLLCKKFVEKEGRLKNKKLSEIMEESAMKAHRNTIIGTFGKVLRDSHFTRAEEKLIKAEFKVDEWMDVPSERYSERIIEWISKRWDFLGNGNGNNNSNEIKGEELSTTSTQNPEYKKFISWCEKNAPRTLKMKNPLTEEEVKKLKEDFSAELIKEILIKMQNYAKLYDNISTNLTIRNWIKLDKKRNAVVDTTPRLGYSMTKKYGGKAN